MNTGPQKGVVIRNRLGISSTGTLFVGLQFQVGENEVIPASIYITDKSMRMAGRQLAALGWDLATGDLQELEDQPLLLAGRETEIDIQEEEYNGKKSLKVVRIGPESEKPDKEKVAKMTAKLKAIAKDIPKSVEDIPF